MRNKWPAVLRAEGGGQTPTAAQSHIAEVAQADPSGRCQGFSAWMSPSTPRSPTTPCPLHPRHSPSKIFRQAGIDMEVVPVSSAEYAAKAKRPENSRMNRKKLVEQGFNPLPDWKDALRRYLKEIAEQGD